MDIIELRNKYIELTGNVLNYDKFNIYSIIYHSNSIEGSKLTLEETFLLLDEGLTPKGKTLEHTLMAIDLLKAFEYMLSLAKNKTRLSVDKIKKISSLIMHSTGSEISSMAGNYNSAKGDFRKSTVFAGTTTFMNYLKVPQKTKELIDSINEENSKVKTFKTINNLAFDLHYQMVSIHPFADGNGRLSRLIMNYIQAYHNEPMSIVSNNYRNEYISALNETRESEDKQFFRNFMLSQLDKYLESEIKVLKSEPLTKSQLKNKT